MLNPATLILSLQHIRHGKIDPAWNDDPYVSKFSDDVRKKESALARTELNRLTDRYFGKSIRNLGFRKDSSGKPILDGYNCSMSHSYGWVLTGISTIPFGLDIEMIDTRQQHDFLQAAFSEEEWKEIENDPVAAYKAFTIKEAIAKRNGTGFLMEPNQILISADDFIKTFRMQTEEAMSYFICLAAGQPFQFVFDPPLAPDLLRSVQPSGNGVNIQHSHSGPS